MLQFHSWPSWKCKNNKNLLCWAFVQSRGVFSTSTGTKGHLFLHLTNTRDGEVFCSQTNKTAEVPSWCMSGTWKHIFQVSSNLGISKCMASLHEIQHLSGGSITHHVERRRLLGASHVSNVWFILSAPHQSGKYKTVKCGWRLKTKSPTSKSLMKGNKSTQLVGGHTILIHPVDQHLVKAYRNFQNIWSFQALQCQGPITQLKTSLNGRLASRMHGSIAK